VLAEGATREESQRLGLLIRAKREAKGWSQERLASEMAARGFPWRQSTLTRIENGQRNILWDEAIAVALLLGFNLGEAEPAAFDLQRAEVHYEELQSELQHAIEERDRAEENAKRARDAYRSWGEMLRELRQASKGRKAND
jgi:transcriptional regulator with XRE-family HTH domain